MKPAVILLVEDNPTTRKLVRLALEKRGHSVLEATDGKTALEMMGKHEPALVLLDLVLPDIDGFSLLGQLRALSAGVHLPVLAFTGLISQLDEARISSVGFDDVITKPIEPSRLVPIVEAYLPRSALAEDCFGEGHRLLVVDDDPVQLKLTRFRLSRLGFDVADACDGQQALETMRGTMPSAVVSDVMMPRLDGFGLCLAARQDPKLANVPILLVTSSYVETADRELAMKAGANDLVPRTPDLRELIHSIRTTLSGSMPALPVTRAAIAQIESDHARRVVHQLERQVQHNMGLARRCSIVAAELTVLSGISEIILKHRNLDGALDEALGACFDAGGIPAGALYLLEQGGALRARPLGRDANDRADDLRTFFGREDLLRQIINAGATTPLPSPALSELHNALVRHELASALVVPLVHHGRPLGALLMAIKEHQIDREDFIVFAEGVGNQIIQTLALAEAFSERAAAEREAREQREIADGRAGLLRRVVDDISTLAERLGLSEVANLRHRVLNRLTSTADRDTPPEKFFADALEPFETAFRGYTDANERLVEMNRVLAERNRELVEAKASIEIANAELEAFSYSVSHDLRAPLRAISGFTQMVLEDHAGRLDATGLDHLRLVRESAERMTHLINDLLALAKVARQGLSRSRVDLTAVARAIATRLQAMAPDRGAEVVIAEDIYGQGDAGLLEVLLENLLGNAWKFSSKRERARIEFNRRIDGKHQTYFVRDNGAGFDMTYADRLFGPFQRLHSSGEFDGTGIGLATVQRIARRHGGRTWAEGIVDGGATFYFTLEPSEAQSDTD